LEGKSGDIVEIQPKAAGSSLMYLLTNEMSLDLMHISGIFINILNLFFVMLQYFKSVFLLYLSVLYFLLFFIFLSLLTPRPEACHCLPRASRGDWHGLGPLHAGVAGADQETRSVVPHRSEVLLQEHANRRYGQFF
jgi:hypothetical protein